MSDYTKMQRRRNMVVGGFVLVAFAAFVWMLMMFGNLPIFVNRAQSYFVLIKFPTAPGVQRDTPVRYCGYQIGRVVDVSAPELDPINGIMQHQVRVTCMINKKFQNIPMDVEVKLMKRGFGSSYIEFFWDPEKAWPDHGVAEAGAKSVFMRDNAVLQGVTGIESEIFPPDVQEKIEELVVSIKTLSDHANDIVGNQQNKDNIEKILNNIREAVAQSKVTLKSFEDLSDVSAEKVEALANQLDQTLSEFRILITKINEGKGSAGKFVNDGQFYENLLDTSVELQMTLEQFKIWAAEAREKGLRFKL